jgi:protein-L-isoaspartate(D-aspartate) O-methyltransferase
MNIEKARFNMIEQQIRPWKVLDEEVLNLLSSVPRELFVPDAYKALAFADIAVPLNDGRYLLHPKEEGRLLQAIKPQKHEKVLVVGSTTGYVTAMLASLANEVFAVDHNAGYIEESTAHFAKLNINNINCVNAEPAQGLEAQAPFDVVVVLGSMEVMSDVLKKQIKVGGRMFCILGKEPAMEAVLVERTADDRWTETGLFELLTPSIPNAPEAEKFHF